MVQVAVLKYTVSTKLWSHKHCAVTSANLHQVT